jgi:hypothetical protein
MYLTYSRLRLYLACDTAYPEKRKTDRRQGIDGHLGSAEASTPSDNASVGVLDVSAGGAGDSGAGTLSFS